LLYSNTGPDTNPHRMNLGRMGMEALTPTFSFFPWLCGVLFTEQRHCEEARVKVCLTDLNSLFFDSEKFLSRFAAFGLLVIPAL
jgi:hypothetical protein